MERRTLREVASLLRPLISCAAYRERKTSDDELFMSVDRLMSEMKDKYERFMTENPAYADPALHDDCYDSIMLEKRVWLTALNLRAACWHLVAGSAA